MQKALEGNHIIIYRITEKDELEGTHKNYWIQLLTRQSTSP